MLRNEIEEKYKWDLSSLYKNQEAFDHDYQQAQSLLEELCTYKDHICDSKESYIYFMNAEETLGNFIENLYVYAKMCTDVEPENEQHQHNFAKANAFMQKSGVDLTFVTLELIAHKEVIERYLEDEDCKDFRYPMEELFRTIPHRLDEEREQMLSQVRELTSIAQDTFQSFRLEYEPVVVDGKEEFLNGATYYVFLKNKDPQVRKDAFEHYFKEYQRYENVFANTLIGHTKGQVFFAKTRNYENALEASLYQDRASSELFHKVLYMANEKYRPFLHDYFALRKSILGLKEQHVYDIYLDLVDDIPQSYTIDESFDILSKALSVLGEDYVKLIQRAKEERWIDFLPSKGKCTGAYSWGSYSSNPYILTNFTENYESLSTLAHELGHSMHSYFSHKHNRPMLANYKIFVAEVASTVNEILLNQYLLNTTTDKKVKANILANLLDQLIGTLYRQPMFAQFEEQLHTWVQERKPISSTTLTDYYLSLNKEYFGPSVIVDELQKYGCYYIPHFYYNFYVYKYSVGMAVALSFVKKIKAGQTKDYLTFLQKGGSEPCIDQLVNAGVDPCSDAVYEDAFTYFQQILKEFKQLMQ